MFLAGFFNSFLWVVQSLWCDELAIYVVIYGGLALFIVFSPPKKGYSNPRIKKVANLSVGDEFIFEGVECVIEAFPTRTSIVLKNKKPISGKWSWKQTTFREFQKTARKLRHFFVDDRVIIRDTETTRQIGHVGKAGVVVSLSRNKGVYFVELDDVKGSIYEQGGIHRSNLKLENKKRKDL